MHQTDGVIRKVSVYAAMFVAVAAAWLATPFQASITTLYFWRQDVWLGAALVAALLLAAWRVPRANLSCRPPKLPAVVAVAVLIGALLWGATYWLMENYPITRDEHMAVFDSAIFQGRNLAQPLAPEWRGYAEALVPAFLLDVPHNALLVSGYMPGNAAMRTAFDLVGDPALMNPLLVAAGLIALFDVAKRMFADRPAAIWVALAGYILSAQILVTAMTTYAMTAHLALNLIWLALFLRNRWWSHLAAIVIGLWAIGLHQVVFHPLFAGPFILTLALQRRWIVFAAYALCYGGGLLAWLGYPSLVVATYGIDGGASSTGGIGAFFTERVLGLLAEPKPDRMRAMAFNLFRFVTWNAAFLTPFAVLGWPRIRDWKATEWPLAVGIAATIAAMAVILPYQGHGWGYRYLHGVLGNFVLLAASGYARRSAASLTPSQVGGAFAILACVTAMTLPAQLALAHRFTAPYARLHALVQSQPADFVVIDTETTSAAIDTVRNRADLTNRPLTFSSRSLTDWQLDRLCDRGTVSLFGAQAFRAAGFYPELTGREGSTFAARRAATSMWPCYRSTTISGR